MIDRDKDASDVQMVILGGRRYVVLPESEYRRLAGADQLPELPEPDAAGNYPAVAYARASLARKLIRRRRAAGLSQAELARAAGIRPETLCRIESGKVTPTLGSIDRIDAALRRSKQRAKPKR
jgi:DNA-binding XRE family transcriptional regulator